MTAYLIARITVRDPARFSDFTAKAPALIARHGGKFIVRGGDPATLEGPEENRRIVVIAFPDRAAAEAFYADPDHQALCAIRWEAAESEHIVVDGV